MPEQISLDDSSYNEIFQRAMEKIRSQAPWWTHTEVSDPGIMLVEMWALLTDMQSYYLDQVQESHYRKYLQLLGIRPDEGECAWTWIFFEFGMGAEREYVIPAGTKLVSDRMVFETEEPVRLRKNGLKGFYQGTGENRADAMKLFRKNSFVLEDEKKRERELFSFVLENALDPEEDIRFFVLLDETKKRNEAEKDFYMARLAWEYKAYDGWREASVIRDDTKGLLFSGIVCLRLGRHGSEEKGRINRIRCRIKGGAYDVMPILYKICFNVVKAVQRNTLCCEEELEFTEDCHRVAVKSYLAATGRLWFLKEVPRKRTEIRNNGKLWEDITAQMSVDQPIREGCMERCVSYGGTGHVKMVCADSLTAPEELSDYVTGIASQRITLPWQNVMRSSVSFLIRQEQDRYRTYRREDPEEDRYGNAWHWDGEENVIVLGDGRHGDIPPESENGLRMTSLMLCEGEKGNVSVGRITNWERKDLFSEITCMNWMPGRDGRSPMAPSLQFSRIREVLSRQNRMVTEEDIRNLALETPGLLIGKVQARWDENKMIVNVFPQYHLSDPYCVERYRSRVENHLEPYRLAGTKTVVEIMSKEDEE